MTDPFDALREHQRRTPPDVALIQEAAAGHRRRKLVRRAASTVVVVACVVGVTLATSVGAGPSVRDRLVDAGPSVHKTADTPAPSPLVARPPATPPPPSLSARATPGSYASAALSFPIGFADGIYGLEQVVDGGRPSFRLVRIDSATLSVTRSPVLYGTAGGLAVDNTAVYVGVRDSRAVLRFRLQNLHPLGSWRDPIARLQGQLVATRSGLWVVDTHGLTRLLGDGSEGGGTPEASTDQIVLTPDYSDRGLLADSFWMVDPDARGCPSLYRRTGLNGLEGTPTPALHGSCDLGLGTVAATPTGAIVAVPTGMLGSVVSVTQSGDAGMWKVTQGPHGFNGILPSVAGSLVFISTPRSLTCLSLTLQPLATVLLPAGSTAPPPGPVQVLQAGSQYFLAFTTGQTASPNGPRIQRFTPDPRCH